MNTDRPSPRAQARAAAPATDAPVEKPARRHGTSKVGISNGDAPPVDPLRLVGRLDRLRDSLKRATGERKASLEAEVAALTEQLEAHKKAITAALAGEAPEIV